MGEIAVNQPQDLLQNLKYSAMKSRRKWSSDGAKPTANRRRKSPTVIRPPSNAYLVIGQVKILKRGEALPEINNKNNKEANYQTPVVRQDLKVEEMDHFVLSSTDRLGPEPEVKKVSRVDAYAGCGVIGSPAPSSLPVPSFLLNKKLSTQVEYDVQ